MWADIAYFIYSCLYVYIQEYHMPIFINVIAEIWDVCMGARSKSDQNQYWSSLAQCQTMFLIF